MSLQNLAIIAIEAISKSLDPLVKKYGFNIKLRSSDAVVYTEVLGYEKDQYEIQISACMHPHDYPHYFSIRLIEKEPDDWKYVSIEQLLQLSKDCPRVSDYTFPISTPEELEGSCERLASVIEVILLNQLYKLIPRTISDVSFIKPRPLKRG